MAVRDMGSSRKGKEERGRSKSRSGYRDLRKNQYAFCREIGHWKVDCSKFKGKKKESKAEANLAKVTNTQRSSSQADGSDSDSLGFSFSVITPIVGHSWEDEWILDTGTTFHASLIGGGFLALRSWRGVRSVWAMITHVASVSYTHLTLPTKRIV